MLVSAAVNRIQQRLGRRSDLSTEIVNELNDAQDRLEGGVQLLPPFTGVFLPWFLRSEVGSFSTVAGEERVALPCDFIREVEEDALWYFNPDAEEVEDEWVELVKDSTDFLRGDKPGSGPPEKYSIDGAYFRIFPTPDDVYELKFVCFKRAADATISPDVETVWLKHAPYLVIGEAGYEMAMILRDQNAVQYFDKMKKEEAQRLFVTHEAREHDNRRYAMGDQD